MTIVMLITAVYLLLLVAILTPNDNVRSKVSFKVIPFVLGILLIVGVAAENGWITVNVTGIRHYFTTWL